MTTMSVPDKLRIISANDHMIEQADMYEGRVEKKWADRAPRIVRRPNGGQEWIFEKARVPLFRHCAVAGMSQPEWLKSMVISYEDMRPGCYDPKARLEDMDADGVEMATLYSSPAGIGFGGDMFALTDEDDL